MATYDLVRGINHESGLVRMFSLVVPLPRRTERVGGICWLRSFFRIVNNLTQERRAKKLRVDLAASGRDLGFFILPAMGTWQDGLPEGLGWLNSSSS